MIDGFFRIAFTGAAGSGFGMLVLRNGSIAGADVAGSFFDGNYTEEFGSEEIRFEITMTIPAGASPVQTGVPLSAPMTLPIGGVIKRGDMSSGSPVLIKTPLGPVNIIFNKIRDIA